MINPKYLLSLVIVTIASGLISYITTPNESLIIYFNMVASSIFVSSIFYTLVIYIPELQRRRMITKTFVSQFEQFKKNCISNFLILSKSQSYKNRENLLNQDEFRRYFQNKNEFGNDRWGEILNGIQDNQYYLDELIYELQMFNEEIKYIRNSIFLNNADVYAFLTGLSQTIHRYERTKQEYDDIKSFSRFLWEIFTGWNWVDGYENADYIKNMILKVN